MWSYKTFRRKQRTSLWPLAQQRILSMTSKTWSIKETDKWDLKIVALQRTILKQGKEKLQTRRRYNQVIYLIKDISAICVLCENSQNSQ